MSILSLRPTQVYRLQSLFIHSTRSLRAISLPSSLLLLLLVLLIPTELPQDISQIGSRSCSTSLHILLMLLCLRPLTLSSLLIWEKCWIDVCSGRHSWRRILRGRRWWLLIVVVRLRDGWLLLDIVVRLRSRLLWRRIAILKRVTIELVILRTWRLRLLRLLRLLWREGWILRMRLRCWRRHAL